MLPIKYLIFGNYNAVMLSLIARLKKEREQIFTLIEDKELSLLKPSGVFQEYVFDYSSTGISHVIESVLPDVVIYAAAFDDCGDSISGQKSVQYISGLTNIMIAISETRVRRFIYLSADTRYFEEKDSMVKLGEDLCKNFTGYDELTFQAIRIGPIYGTYKKQILYNSIGTILCEKVVNKQPNNNDIPQMYQLLYIEDAVEGIFRIIRNEQEVKKYYILEGYRQYSKNDIYKMLQKADSKELVLVKQNEKHCCDDMVEFNFFEKYGLEEGILNLYEKAHSQLAEGEHKKTTIWSSIGMAIQNVKLFLFGSRVMPFVENLVIFVFLQLIMQHTQQASFHKTIDLYLLYVVLFATTHGMMQAIISVFLSVFGKFYLMYSMEGIRMLFQQFDKYLWLIQIFIIGVLVGYLKDKYRKKIQDYQQQEKYLTTELTNITEINKSNRDVKEIYENRILSYKDSFVNLYDVISQLDEMESHKVIFNTTSIICDLIHSKDVAIYICDKYGKFGRLMAASSEYARKKGKSLELAKYLEMQENLKMQEVYSNRNLNMEYPAMAGGTYSGEQLQMVIAIWTLPLNQNNLNQANIFSAMCRLVGKTMDRVYQYMESIHSTSYIAGTPIMNEGAFLNIIQMYEYGYQKKYLEYTILRVIGFDGNQEELFGTLKPLVRDTDYIGLSKERSVYVLLTNTDQNEVKFVIDRFVNRNITVEITNAVG